MHKSAPIAAAVATAVSLLMVAPSLADAAPAKGFGLPFDCTDGQSVFLVAPPGHAVFMPGIAVGIGGVLKPVAFHVVDTVTNPDGSVTVTTSDLTQANGTVDAQNPNVAVQCYNDSTYVLDDGGTLDQAITITGFFTGPS